jgi:hypothetical protein
MQPCIAPVGPSGKRRKRLEREDDMVSSRRRQAVKSSPARAIVIPCVQLGFGAARLHLVPVAALPLTIGVR